MSNSPPFIPFEPIQPDGDPLEAVEAFRHVLAQRRSIRHFSTKPVDRAIIDSIIGAAGTAPSGANKQPWRFVVIGDPVTKRRIREAAENEERAFYEHRASSDWLEDLAPLQTGPEKPFLEDAPWLIVVFKLMRDDRADAVSERVYYVNESVGIATGMLLAAAQHAGLVTLTHTPSPMGFLREVLGRPDYERPYLLIPIGWPADSCMVPDIERKPLEEIMVLHKQDEDQST
jgi:iodotyrosine deiodinase